MTLSTGTPGTILGQLPKLGSVLPSKMEYAWDTLPLADGREIIAGCADIMFGAPNGSATLIIRTKDGLYNIVSSDLISENELADFLKLKNANGLLPEQEKTGGDRKRNEYRRDFESLL